MEITFVERETFGKKTAALRKEGKVPVVCYGNKEKVQHAAVALRTLEKLLATEEVLFDGEGVLKGKKVVLQEVDLHPVTEKPIHADFLFVDIKQEIEHAVPVHVVGEAPGVKVEKGELIIVMNEVVLRALPQEIPKYVEAEVGGLMDIGSHLYASDLRLPEKVTLVTDPKEIVVSIVKAPEEEEEEIEKVPDMEAIEVTGKGKRKDSEATDTEEESSA